MEQIQVFRRTPDNTAYGCDLLSEEEYEKQKAEAYNKMPGRLNERPDGYDCALCMNKGDIARAEPGPGGWWTLVHSPCKCLKIRKTIGNMQRSGLKSIIRDYTFDKYEAEQPWQQSVKEAAMAYAREPDGWFFIGGQSGAGKTHLCTAICRKFLLEGMEVRYMLWRDEIVRIKQLANDYGQYQELIDRYKRVQVLYIDDLFKTCRGADGREQRPTAADINAAFEIINGRYNDPKKLTVISSECTIDDLLGIDEAVAGRIFERAKAINLQPDRAKNYRLRGAIEL